MLRSLYSGVSGLRNQQIRLDVIGNNIANVNTIGYKGSRCDFLDMLYQTMNGAAAPQGGRGGINPKQVGIGMGLGTIAPIMTQGNIESTGRNTDLAIEGDGFFVLGDDNGATYFTRAGGFSFDEAGNLVNPGNGLKVQGWSAVNGVVDPVNTPIGFIHIQKGIDLPPSATTTVTYLGNFDSRLAAGYSFTLKKTIYDEQGGSHDLAVTMTKDAITANQWNWSVDAANNPDFNIGAPGPSGAITFNANGSLDSWTVNGARVYNQASQPAAGMADGDWWIDTANGNIPYQYDLATTAWVQKAGSTPAPIALPFPAATGLNDVNAFLNFGNVTQYASTNSLIANDQNGYARGSLAEINVDNTGVVTGYYSNGRSRALAQVALAVFNNPEGLMRAGDTLFQESTNSGDALIGVTNTGGRGTLKPGSLEMSNVDLSQEFTNLIITQRGFQASSRVITTSDEVLQELVNLKR